MLKHEGFKVGQKIRAQDFAGMGDRCYIEGKIKAVNPNGTVALPGIGHYVIDVTSDHFDGHEQDSVGSRAGREGFVPMETTFDWDDRVTEVK